MRYKYTLSLQRQYSQKKKGYEYLGIYIEKSEIQKFLNRLLPLTNIRTKNLSCPPVVRINTLSFLWQYLVCWRYLLITSVSNTNGLKPLFYVRVALYTSMFYGTFCSVVPLSVIFALFLSALGHSWLPNLRRRFLALNGAATYQRILQRLHH